MKKGKKHQSGLFTNGKATPMCFRMSDYRVIRSSTKAKISASAFCAFSISSLASATNSLATASSLSESALIFTFMPAPSTALRAASAPTPASLTLFGLPLSTMARQSSNTPNAVCIVCKGTCAAKSVAR